MKHDVATWSLDPRVGPCLILSVDNVNPGLINPKRLFNWEGTIKYQMKWLLEEYPLIVINHGFLPNPGLTWSAFFYASIPAEVVLIFCWGEHIGRWNHVGSSRHISIYHWSYSQNDIPKMPRTVPIESHRIPGNPILENSMTNPIHPTKTIPKNPNPDPSDLNCQTSFLDCAAADASAAEVQKLLDLAISHGISHMELSNSSLYP